MMAQGTAGRLLARAARQAVLLMSIAVLPGCASLLDFKPPATPLMDGAVETPVAAYHWRTITGGTEGNNFAGLRNVSLIRPVAVAARGNDVYIVDVGALLLYHYNLASEKLTVQQDLHHVLAGDFIDIFLAEDYSYYLAIADAGRVLHYDRFGELIRVFEDKINLGRPVAVAEDPATGYVYIADAFNDDVLVYNTAGLLQGAIGSRGTEQPGQFHRITTMGLGPAGLYIGTRFGEYRVQIMRLDGSYAGALQKDTVTFPLSIAVDRNNRVFVSGRLDNSITIYHENRQVDKLGGTGSAPGRFRQITDLWLDQGLLYVADSLNGRVQILRVVAGAANP